MITCLETATSLAHVLSRQSSAKGSEVAMCYFSHRVILSLCSCPVCWHSWCRARTPLLAASVAAAGACAAREQHRGWRSESGKGAPARDGLGLAGADKLAEQGLGRVSRSHKDVWGQCAYVKPCTDVFSVRVPSQVVGLQLPGVCLKGLWSHLQLYCPVFAPQKCAKK